MADQEIVEKTIAEDLVVTKYKLAGEIVNRTYSFQHTHFCPNQTDRIFSGSRFCVGMRAATRDLVVGLTTQMGQMMAG